MEKITKNTETITINDLAKKVICDGYLYINGVSKKFTLLKPGIFIDADFIKKYAVKNQKFEFESVIDRTEIDQFKILFSTLRKMNFEKHVRNQCKEILNSFFKYYSSDQHFLNWALACYEHFCSVSLDIQNRIHESDIYLYRKSLYSAGFSVLICLCNDFYHYKMISDLYNLTFLVDVGLCGKDFSYNVAEACNQESRIPGSGRFYLHQQNVSEVEQDLFYDHPELSYKMIKDLKLLYYPELAECVLYQHELADGTGFPRGVTRSEVSRWEAVVMLSNSLIDISSSYEWEMSPLEFIKTFNIHKCHDVAVGAVFNNLRSTFQSINSFLEIA